MLTIARHRNNPLQRYKANYIVHYPEQPIVIEKPDCLIMLSIYSGHVGQSPVYELLKELLIPSFSKVNKCRFGLDWKVLCAF